MNLVVDCSALVRATTGTDDGARSLRARLVAETTHAPHLIDAEVGSVLRRMTHRGQLAPGLAAVLLDSAPGLIDHRYGHRAPLAARAWALRENVSFYAGLYVALAASLDAVLLTADRPLATAPALPCEVEVIG